MFQHSVDEELIQERTGHRSNALFIYEKNSIEQERNIKKILRFTSHRGNYVETNINTEYGEGEDIAGLGDLECELSDELMPIPNVTEQVKSSQIR